MAKSKRSSPAIGKPSADGQPAKRKKKTPKPIEEPKKKIVTPEEEYHAKVYEAVKNIDHEALVKLLAMNVEARYGDTYEYHDLYSMLVLPTDEQYEHQHAALMACLHALLNDRRYATFCEYLFGAVCSYRRQHVDILDVIVRHDHARAIQYGYPMEIKGFGSAHLFGNDRLVEYLLHKPCAVGTLNVPWLDAVHRSVGGLTNPYNPRMLPVLLSNASMPLDSHRKEYHTNEYRTALSHADKTYTRNSVDVMKKVNAVRHIRLLLSDGRVDVHLMRECGVDQGYAQIEEDEDEIDTEISDDDSDWWAW